MWAYHNLVMTDREKHFRWASVVSALWLIGAALVANALVIMWIHWQPGTAEAGGVLMAAPMPPLVGHGKTVAGPIKVVPTQLSATHWGVVLVDTHNDVFAIYRFVGTQCRIQLMASRDFRSDLQLKDFNNLAPTPAQVKAMVTAGKALTQP
ncbi:MAG: hypothetical protein ACP5I8_00580 [Phycisphaerae bacterium]